MMPGRQRTACLAPAFILLFTQFSLLFAQERLSVGPLAGVYLASSAFVGPSSDPSGSAPYKQRIAPVLGIQATYWSSPRVGLGAALAWSSSDVSRPGAAADTSLPSSVRLVAAFLAVRVGSLERDNDVHVRLGLAQVAHRGQAFEPFDEPKPLAVTTGVEATLPVGPHLRGAAGFDVYLYSFQLNEPGTTYEKRLMVDAVARVGVTWGFGER
jgi:hypothetical protein